MNTLSINKTLLHFHLVQALVNIKKTWWVILCGWLTFIKFWRKKGLMNEVIMISDRFTAKLALSRSLLLCNKKIHL